MDQELLRKLQLKELEILKEIDRICKKNDIQYFGAYGSVLGAVRHSGFIPWDDDIDIYMLDKEYEKFEKACETDMDHEKFFLQTIETDYNVPCPWAKIRMNNTCSMDGAYKNKKIHWGICIDIFRLQYIPNSEKKLKKLIRLKWLYSGICQSSFVPCSSISHPKELAQYLIQKIIRGTVLRKFMEKKISSYNKDVNHKKVLDDSEMRIISSDFFENVTMVKFEDMELPCPNMPEKYLEIIYGDWKKFPDIEDRYGHKGIIVDTEKSYLEYQNR